VLSTDVVVVWPEHDGSTSQLCERWRTRRARRTCDRADCLDTHAHKGISGLLAFDENDGCVWTETVDSVQGKVGCLDTAQPDGAIGESPGELFAVRRIATDVDGDGCPSRVADQVLDPCGYPARSVGCQIARRRSMSVRERTGGTHRRRARSRLVGASTTGYHSVRD